MPLIHLQINHPNVVRLRSVTTTRAFNDSSVLFAYDFYPNAVSLETFIKKEGRLLDEETIWSFITQLVSGLHAIHGAGLAARILKEKHVLLTGLDSCTVKINCVAMADVIDVGSVDKSNSSHPLGEARFSETPCRDELTRSRWFPDRRRASLHLHEVPRGGAPRET